MISLLKRLFLDHWQRKVISLILAMIIWMVVNQSMTTSKTVANVSVRVIHLPPGKTIEGMLGNGTLAHKLTLDIVGNKACLEELSSRNLEVVIDAAGQPNEWIANISKKNLACVNAEVQLDKFIHRVAPQEIIIKQSTLVTERIPVLVTQPTGEAPQGYQFLDIWPYQLYLTVAGPEETVKRLKQRGLKMTFNLADISKAELDTMQSKELLDEVSFFIPNAWKKLPVPSLSETPLEIDDPLAASLRIDFSRQDLLPLGIQPPVSIFFPPKFSHTLNPETYSVAVNDLIVKKNGIKIINAPLFAEGVSKLFLETVRDMIQVVVVAAPKSERETLLWNAQFINPHELENRYVAKVFAESEGEGHELQPHMREAYLRNRFRSYMSRFRLYTPDHKKLSLKIELQANTISISQQN